MTFENLLNFRDLGGRVTADGDQVRPGRLYRSESVAYMSAGDVARLVDELGLATIVDLRGEREVARTGRGPIADRPLRYIHVPITDVIRGMGGIVDFYVGVLSERGTELAGLLRTLLEPGALPAVVHCEAGCDRTGVVAAAVLGILRVPDEEIISDYELTRDAFPAMNARWRANFISRGHPPEKFIDETWIEREEAMARTVATVRERWGDWAGWASAHGFTADEQERLRKLLLA
jgi:protein-tyrosine phosphatase